MPFTSMLSSLNCASSRSSKLQKRTSSMNKKKSAEKTSASTSRLNIEPNASSSSPSAPLAYQQSSSEQLPDLTQTTKLGRGLRRLDSTPNGESFWDIGNYKYVLKRCDNGNKLSSELADMITERGKLEESYAKSLRQWAKKWSDHLENESNEYGTTKDAWYGFLEVIKRFFAIIKEAYISIYWPNS